MDRFSEERYRMDLIRYLSKNKGKTEIDYLNYEIERLEIILSEIKDQNIIKEESTKKFIEDFGEDIVTPNYKKDLDRLVDNDIYVSHKNKSNLKSSIQFYTKKLQLENLLHKEDEFDYGNEKDIDKVRFLIEMGLVDYLSKNYFTHSASSLATALSGVTGIKHSTLKGYLNAYLSTPENKQNPMNDSKKVGVIQMKLKAIGFKK
jgi:hypothetical protein